MQVAFLIDGGFLEKKFKGLLGNFPLPQEVLEICRLAMNDQEFVNDQLFRIYYYDCEPFSGTTTHPITGQLIDFSTSAVFVRKSAFLRDLKLMPRVAFRSGSLSLDGWNIPLRRIRSLIQRIQQGQNLTAQDLVPNLRQKKVDIKIGLDIASLASKRIVEKIVLITGDSDFVPAMKTARKEGVMVYLLHLDHQVKEELKEHCDGIVTINLGQLSRQQPTVTQSP
jgi:uncharacterized LabA/DUF88 family protein